MDGTSDGLKALHKSLDRLQDELLAVDPRKKRPDHVILKDIDGIEALIDDIERETEGA